MRRLALGVATLWVAFVASAAAEETVVKVRDNLAFANGSTYEECGGATISVWASKQVEKVKQGPREVTRSATIGYSRYSYCTGVTSTATVEVPLTGGIDLDGMTLKFTVPVANAIYTYDEEGNAQIEELPASTLSGKVVLTGQGYIATSNGRRVMLEDGQTQILLDHGNERAAEATFNLKLDGQRLDVQPGPAGLFANASGKITRNSLPAVPPSLPPLSPSQREGATYLVSTVRGASATFNHGDDPGCVSENLEVAAYENDSEVLPGSGPEHVSMLRLSYSHDDACQEDLHVGLRFEVNVPNALQIEGLLQTMSASIDQVVTAEACSYVPSTGELSCAPTTATVTADFLWEGTGEIFGGVSSATSRTETNVHRTRTQAYYRMANLIKTVIVDGQPIAFGTTYATASLVDRTDSQSDTPR